MRQIKFRGKRHNGEWVYGSVVYSSNSVVAIHYEIDTGAVRRFDWCYVDPDTVGQFTGLYDRNGKEIYEGDIVKTRLSKNFFGIVTWHTDGYFFFDTSNGEWKRWSDGYRPAGEMLRLRCDGTCVDFEVIGNIYDNPELLKK